MKKLELMKGPFSPKEKIEYAEGSIVSQEFIHNRAGNLTLFSFDEGQQLSEHTAPFDAVCQILDGEAGNSHRRGRLSSYGGSDAHHAGKRTPFGTCREGIQDAAYYDQGINLYSCALFLSLQNRKRAYLFRQQNNSRDYSVPQSTDENIFQFRKDRDSREETP